MIDVKKLEALHDPKVLLFGNHAGIVQSILDFDYLAGKAEPSVVGIVGVRQKNLRFFWGGKEILLRGHVGLAHVPEAVKNSVHLFAVAQSGRRAVTASIDALEHLPHVVGGMIFAEGVPEQHALDLREVAEKKGMFILGPASVGMTVGGLFKLGAIGGTLPEQVASSGIVGRGTTAVVSTSGGMINELISMVAKYDGSISFAAAVGGERFPLTKPAALIEQALLDKQTTTIVFFGELGGTDEYEIADLLKAHKNAKPLIAYVAGTVAEKFASAPQFGHAKAMAQDKSETATAKKQALAEAGAKVAHSFAEYEELVSKHVPEKGVHAQTNAQERLQHMSNRSAAMFVNRISSDKGGEVTILGKSLVDFVGDKSFTHIALSMFLGTEPTSKKLPEFFDTSLRLLVDHGPQVSGAVNTMITARAGKDLTASLATGILTIGPRFGGAINQAAENWFLAVQNGESPELFVERFAKSKEYVSGIGHKKYRLDNPDPRVKVLLEAFDSGGRYTAFAKEVARITTNKKAQLILNVDGAIAALLLDILESDEGYDQAQLKEVIDGEVCNAIFVLARSVGFIAHYLEQKRLDEGLFRLPDEHISVL